MTSEGMKKIMIEALKKVYKEQYDAIQPIPYVKDKLYCVDKIFVDGGADVTFFKGKPPTDLKQLNWTKLDSYKEIFKNDKTASHRCIIDGDPGYGKSTLTLQLAYDWSNGISDSPLCDVEILILLRLRQMKNLQSIYRAIKYILLPTEHRLKVKDIQQVIEKCSSVVFALDGYDEFPHQSDQENDINKIVTSKIFNNIDVTLTTRILPPQLTGATGPSTKLVKLRGFDEAAREEYIRKAVVGDDETAVERIKKQLRENPVVHDLCQIPLLFVIFAHMFLEYHVIPMISTATGAVRHMISCFHQHMREKMKDTNVKAVPDFENEHSELDKIAFEGLTNKNQQLIWKRDDLLKRLGKEFYDMYIRIGLLVEETVFTENTFTTEVHFYHKIFCEWFAAHYFVQIVKRSDIQFDTAHFDGQRYEGKKYSSFLRHLNPNDLKYFFLFSCGIDHHVGNMVIRHLHTPRNIHEVLLSCISEKPDNIDGIQEIVKEICSSYNVLYEGSLMVRTRDTLRVLDIGCKHGFPIKCLDGSFGSFQEDGDGILLPSELRLPFFNSLKQLRVDFGNRIRVSEEEFEAFLETVMKFEQLDELRFHRCILPDVIPTAAAIIKSRKIKIFWEIHSIVDLTYRLARPSGEWKLQNLKGIRGNIETRNTTIGPMELANELCIESLRRLFREVKKHSIPISHLIFEDRENTGNVRVLANNDLMPPSMFGSVEKVIFRTKERTNRSLNRGEFAEMLDYAQEIPNVKEVWFERCILPFTNPTQSFGNTCDKNIAVYWIPAGLYRSLYQLNLVSGFWEDCDTLLEVDEAYYKQAVTYGNR